MKVFVSYSWHPQDKDAVDRIARGLSDAGIPYWLDQHDLRDKRIWLEEVGVALAKCDIVLLCYSDHLLEQKLWGAVHLEHLSIQRLREKRGGRPYVLPIAIRTSKMPPGQFAGPRPLRWNSNSDTARLVDAVLEGLSIGLDNNDFCMPSSVRFNSASPLSLAWDRLTSEVIPPSRRWTDRIVVIEIPDVCVGLLGQERTTFIKSYIGMPPYRRVLDALTARYPFGLMTEIDRKGYVIDKLLDLFEPETSPESRSDTLDPLLQVLNGIESLPSMLELCATEVLEALRGDGDRYKVLTEVNVPWLRSHCVLGLGVVQVVRDLNRLDRTYSSVWDSLAATLATRHNATAVVGVLLEAEPRGFDVQELRLRCRCSFSG